MMLTNTKIYNKKLQLFSFCFITIIISLLQAAEAKQPTKRQKLKFCKLDVLHHCFYEPISAFTSSPNGTGFPETEADFEQWCFSLHDYVPYCARAWMRQCGLPLHEAAFSALVLTPFQQSIKEVCSNQSTRAEFLLHSKCMAEKVKLTDHYRDTCVRHFQGDFEMAAIRHNGSFGNYFRASCCAYNSWERCIVGQLTKQCSPQAGAIFVKVIRAMAFHFWASFCPMEWYDPEKVWQCPPKLYRAPDDYLPEGLQSGSFFSHAFAVGCPNAAFGVDAKRDVL